MPRARVRHETIVLDDGFRVGVTRVGSRYGAPLVFLHGLGVSATAYTEMLELLTGRGFSVTALDAPDHGGTDSLPWGHTVADMVEITRRALDALGIRAAVMVGHSMGGAMVAEFAAKHPERALAAILLDAAAGEDHHDAIRIDASPTVALRAFQFFARGWADVIGDGVRAWRVRSFKERRQFSRLLRHSVSGPNCMRAVYALMRHDTAPLLKAMRDKAVPTVIVHGTCDGIVPVLAGASAAKLSGGKLCLVQHGYHSWMLSEPKLGVNAINTAVINAVAVRDGRKRLDDGSGRDAGERWWPHSEYLGRRLACGHGPEWCRELGCERGQRSADVPRPVLYCERGSGAAGCARPDAPRSAAHRGRRLRRPRQVSLIPHG